MDNTFELKCRPDGIIIEKGDKRFSIEKSSDGDIWFNAIDNDMKLSINSYSRNNEEWQSFNIFENLMKSIVGRYMLSEDYKGEYSSLPKDFVDLENKTITWHSDSDNNNTLQLHLSEKELIISIVSDNYHSNVMKVRIRINGSAYGSYYQEFERFFSELHCFAYQVELKREESSNFEKRMSLHKKRSI